MSEELQESSESVDSLLLSKLPTEIVADVFLAACLPGDVQTAASERVNPLFLGSICRAWRDIAWSIPRLWSTVILYLSRERYCSQTTLLMEWLLRARSCPLTVLLSMHTASDDTANEWRSNPPISLLKVLMSYSAQWRYVDIFILDSKTFFSTLGQVKNHLPQLETLSLHPLENANVPHDLLDMFQDAPQLQNLSLFILYLNDLTLPWNQLKSIRARVSSKECVQILVRCPNLEHCSFEAIFDDDLGLPAPPNGASCPNLTSLIITNTPASEMEPILSFAFPNLRKLDLSASPELVITPSQGTLPFESIIALISRSSCPLESLSLSSEQFPGHSLRKCLECLEALPSLVELRLRILYEISITETPCILPSHLLLSENPILLNLQIFEYDGYIQCDDVFLENILALRWTISEKTHKKKQRAAQLKSIKIRTRGDFQVTEEVAERLRQLVRQGMPLTITVGNSEISYF